jgi:hypothetical protein
MYLREEEIELTKGRYLGSVRYVKLQLNDNPELYTTRNVYFTLFSLISDEVLSLNAFLTNKIVVLCSVVLLWLSDCITGTIQVTEGREYFSRGPHCVQSC